MNKSKLLRNNDMKVRTIIHMQIKTKNKRNYMS